MANGITLLPSGRGALPETLGHAGFVLTTPIGARHRARRGQADVAARRHRFEAVALSVILVVSSGFWSGVDSVRVAPQL